METNSKVLQFFKGKNVFLTGGNGTVGEVLVEKLLRCHVGKLYVLCRSKRSKTATERMRAVCETVLFSKLRSIDPNFFKRIRIVEGDVGDINLGISDTDRMELTQNVQLVIHGAADVRFETPLASICLTNIRGTREMLTLAGEMKHLIAFAYVSTAFSHCPLLNIDERFYPAPIDPDVMIRIAERFADDGNNVLAAITDNFISPWPNTYSFSKAVSEELVRRAEKILPVVVIRPSIVTVIAEEPVKGWGTNFYGINGTVVAGATGLMRVASVNKGAIAHLVCTDQVVNATLTVLWDIGSKNLNANILGPNTAKVFTVTLKNSKTFGNIFELCMEEFKKVPIQLAIWCPIHIPTQYKILTQLLALLLEVIPNAMLDLGLKLTKNKKRILPQIRKIWYYKGSIHFFNTNLFNFECVAIPELYKSLSDDDRQMFPCVLENFDWDTFIPHYMRGVRAYIVKEPMDRDSIERSKRRLYWFKFANSILKAVFYSFLAFLLVYPLITIGI